MQTSDPKSRTETVSTVFAITVVLALTAACIFFSDLTLTDLQKGTLNTLLIVCTLSIAYCFIVGELTQNYSQMDKLWSILPIVYVWIIAVRGGMKTRLVVYALIVTVWGIRLTLNFARKGAYSLKFWTGVEDYRWSIVRSSPVFERRILWTLFDLLFISTYQNLLVLAICLPALACMESQAPLGFFDAVAILTAVLFLLLETVSDEYQWKFHQTKKKLLAQGTDLADLPKPYDLGFNTFGPWKRMRHPNYLGEQGIWMCLYLFTIASKVVRYGFLHWTMTGPLLLILLFMGSSMLGERISSSKYPMYRDYVQQVHKYLPSRRYD